MPHFSLTTWSLHRHLGPLRLTRWDETNHTVYTEEQEQPETVSLLDLPAVLAQKGFGSLEVCHFHIPDTGEAYAHRLKQACRDAGIRLYTLLLDYGDISSANEKRRQADIEWLKRWIDFAALTGAERVRIIGGDAQPADREALERSADGLKQLSEYAAARGVRALTENFRPLTSTADNCLALLQACGDRLGLVSDFGNFHGPTKYDDLEKTVPLSESIHAKAQTDDSGLPDAEEYRRCLDIVKSSGYEGPITIVFDGPTDMWEGIERLMKLVRPYL